jgi:hypothetical protein
LGVFDREPGVGAYRIAKRGYEICFHFIHRRIPVWHRDTVPLRIAGQPVTPCLDDDVAMQRCYSSI